MTFHVGDRVEYEQFEEEWTGPYVIEIKYANDTYVIGTTTEFIDLVHISRLRPYSTPPRRD